MTPLAAKFLLIFVGIPLFLALAYGFVRTTKGERGLLSIVYVFIAPALAGIAVYVLIFLFKAIAYEFDLMR